MPIKKLSELCAAIPDCRLIGDDVDVVDIAYDSRKVVSGSLFVALVGAKSDGHDYIPEATSKGAAALAITTAAGGWYGQKGLPVIVMPNTREALPKLSAAFFDEPSRDLFQNKVTGTNGNTSTTTMGDSIFRIIGDR